MSLIRGQCQISLLKESVKNITTSDEAIKNFSQIYEYFELLMAKGIDSYGTLYSDAWGTKDIIHQCSEFRTKKGIECKRKSRGNRPSGAKAPYFNKEEVPSCEPNWTRVYSKNIKGDSYSEGGFILLDIKNI